MNTLEGHVVTHVLVDFNCVLVVPLAKMAALNEILTDAVPVEYNWSTRGYTPRKPDSSKLELKFMTLSEIARIALEEPRDS